MRSTAYKKQVDLDRCSLTQQKLMFFTRVAPRTKSKGALDRQSTHLLLLSARVSPRTKRKGAPDRCFTHLLLLLSARASPRTKSKGLHRYVLQIYYVINQVFKSFCSSAGIINDGLDLP
jgi:hypothetical protein